MSDKSINDIEKEAIIEHLEKYKFNVTYTAASLKMSRATLYRKMKKYNIIRTSI